MTCCIAPTLHHVAQLTYTSCKQPESAQTNTMSLWDCARRCKAQQPSCTSDNKDALAQGSNASLQISLSMSMQTPNCVPFCLWLCCSGSTRSPYRRTVFWKMPGKGSGTGIACGTTHRACTQRSPACLAMSASNNTGKAARTDHLLVHANDNHKLQKGKLFLHRSRQQPASLPSNAGTAVQAE